MIQFKYENSLSFPVTLIIEATFILGFLRPSVVRVRSPSNLIFEMLNKLGKGSLSLPLSDKSGR